MRFRLLNESELEELSEEFIQFLVVQGIDDDLWRQINREDKAKAEEIVKIFSDAVWTKVYSKVSYLRYLSSDVFSLFKIENEKMELIMIKKRGTEADFQNIQDVYKTLNKGANHVEIFRSSREFGDKILDEIHKLSNQGCLISDKETWESMHEFVKKTSN